MIKADAKQKQIIAILTKGDKDFKAELVEHQTKDASKRSTNDLSFYQANQIISQLGGTAVQNRWCLFNVNSRAHLNILSLCMQLGWQWYNDTQGRYYANMNTFGGWLQTKAPVKKPLLDMQPQEVSKTIAALESMISKSY
ncbi:hypothetical protein, putative phage protein [Formosa agariphila KMM 3901]|uniref:Uncharacterized protein n=1 Tax=Formosa agariphila (strain DSM 15362 / KCTC 12365 / LMG 23005 / KMM 3901 / M-2Alg 35-1) TaxID=1347342 RepID=T2KP11_FORAG|nr:hypothetical protein [Formosa agariphila]CDF80602.1 hypothetical protein, putative phage protein [Formosa agariphila KMM 3901]